MSNCELTKFTLSEPDSDGDMSAELELSGTNTSGQDVRLIKTHAILFSKEGVAFAKSSNEEAMGLEPGEEFTINAGHFWLRAPFPECYAGPERDGITCSVSAVLYKRELHRLGEIDVPKDHKSLVTLSKKIDTDALERNINIAIGRQKPDEDGDCALQIRCGLFNPADMKCREVALKVEILDEDDSVLGSDETRSEVNPKAWALIDSSIWGVNKGLLRTARARCSLAIFHPVLTLSCEGKSSAAE
jgi:hypothetical protein